MIDTYKNTERLRYRLNKDILNLYDEIKKENDKRSVTFIDEFFSTIASSVSGLFASQEAFIPLRDSLRNLERKVLKYQFPEIIISAISIALCVLIFLIIYVLIYSGLKKFKNKNSVNKPEGKDYTDYIKEFDNIACDSIFVAIEYTEVFLSTVNQNEKEMYFFEAIHYLETASILTKMLCQEKKNLKTSRNCMGVDIYRVRNINEVMRNLSKNLGENINDLNLIDYDKTSIENKINSINNSIDYISGRISELY